MGARCQLMPAIAAGFVLVGGAVASAHPAGDVPTSGEPGPGLLHAEVEYSYEADRAAITRERVGVAGADPQDALPRQRELDSHQTRQLVTPRLELAAYRGLWVSLAAPIVIAQTNEIDVADGVDRAAASTFIDGILPSTGFDASNPSVPPGGKVAFRGVTRRGVEAVRAGLGFAAMSQARDPTQPTWKLGAELALSVGRAMRFDAVHPDQQTGVASGVDQLRLWTAFDRRYRYFESWFEAAWQVPIYTRASGLFTDPGFGASRIAPGQIATTSFGVEAYAYDDPASDRRIAIELGVRGAAHFEGRGYSELWEVFALAGDRRTAGPLVLDGDPTAPGTQAVSHPGITNIENYLEAAARLTVRARLGARLRFAGYGELIGRTEHVISFTDAGTDLPTCPSGAPRCEAGDNTAVTPGTAEVNPLAVPLIDLVGHRYRSEANLGVVIGVEARFVF